MDKFTNQNANDRLSTLFGTMYPFVVETKNYWNTWEIDKKKVNNQIVRKKMKKRIENTIKWNLETFFRFVYPLRYFFTNISSFYIKYASKDTIF